MKAISLIVLLLGVTLFTYSQEHHHDQYTCPMHPEVVSDKPGKCPKCQMELEKKDHQSHENHPVKLAPTQNPLVRPSRPAQTVRYELHVTDTLVTFGKKRKRAIAVNGQIPMPTLEFNQGDTAEIVVYNHLNESTSLHWHGVFLPNKEDGVPWLTQKPIAAGAAYTYRFPIIQHGTHWYHSHSGLQEQIGMYGSFIMHKRSNDTSFRQAIDDVPSVPLVISEWTNLNPHNVNRMLHNASDWFAIKKGATQSYSEAIRNGHFKTKLSNEWKRMLAMDVSDVYYDKVLFNGANSTELKTLNNKPLKAGDKLRLRIANAGASSYFWLRYAGGKMTVVASDGNDVEPVEVDRLIIAVSETYDVLVTVPENGKAFEFMATTEDRTQWASYFIGDGMKHSVNPLPRLDYFEGMKMMNGMMNMDGNLNNMGMKMSLNKMDMNKVMYRELNDSIDKPVVTLNYSMLRSPNNTSLQTNTPIKELNFTLTGNMNRYVWSMDNRILSETDKIPVKKGEVLRITMYNNSMMRHPMHLHGYDFRVLNKYDNHSPLKNVLDIMPMETDTIEFAANEEGDWFFHCHILYHMMAGMNRVFAVGDYQNPNLPSKAHAYRMLQRESNMIYFSAQNDFATNGNDGELTLMNARWNLNTEWRLGYTSANGYEVETHVGRFLGKMQWLMPFVGFDYRYRKMGIDQREKNLFGQVNKKDTRRAVSVGLRYTLPMLVNAQAELYHDGIVRVALLREDIPVSRRLRAGFMINTDLEYMGELRYILTRYAGIRAHYDSDMGIGIGLRLNY